MWCARLAGNAGPKKSPSGHHHTTLSGYIFATKARIDNRKKLVKQQYLTHMSPQYGELRPTSGWDQFVSLGHPYEFQQVSHLGSITAQYSSSGRQPNFAALNRGWRSRWALAHILLFYFILGIVPSLHQSTDFDDLYVTWRVSTQGSAFWGLWWHNSPFRGQVPQKTILGRE